MPLDPGTTLGPYLVEVAIGAGGMGEVYRARDTRLGRTVAIKVLPDANAGDPEVRARFEREARVIAKLSHPHICTLFDVGNHNGIEYLVLEHLEGETLASRLKRGPVPLEQALDLATEIADALDKAHRVGITHRDLKPANVMLTRAGSKLLDFGLAKMSAPAIGSLETQLRSSAGTMGDPITARGTILGTFQYMSPEQVEGTDADARSDLWAFGCVLYEMVTGKRTFEGKTHASLLAAILERDPTPMGDLVPMTPPALGRLVRACLAKDPDDRFQTAHDVGLQLNWLQEGGSAVGLPAPVVANRQRRQGAMWMAVVGAAALVATATTWLLKPAPPVTNVVTRFSYPLPDGQAFTRTGRHSIAISPDGTKLAYIANQQIYVREMNQLEARPLAGTNEDPHEVLFSPDGQWVAYFVGAPAGRGVLLKKIAIAGGTPRTLCTTTTSASGASWRGSTIAFGQFLAGKLDAVEMVEASGGTARPIVSVSESQEIIGEPQLLDDGTHVLATVTPRAAGTDSDIVVFPIKGGERQVLVRGGTDGRLLPTGHLVYANNAKLFAVAVDLKRLEIRGTPVPIVEDIEESNAQGAAQFAVADNGTLAFVPGRSMDVRSVVWADRLGHDDPILPAPRAYRNPRLSPDGKLIALSGIDGDTDIWVSDLAKESLSRLTSGPGGNGSAIWMPNSREIIFATKAPGGSGSIQRRSIDGRGTAERLTPDSEDPTPNSVSPDGKFLVYTDTHPGTRQDLMVLPLEPRGTPRPLIQTPAEEFNGQISPDGHWLAYESTEASGLDVFVRPFPAVDTGKWQITIKGGIAPFWSADGRELFFRASHSGGPFWFTVVTVPVIPAGAPFSVGKPVELFSSGEPYAGGGRDVSPDGRRILMLKRSAAGPTHPSITVVSHWFDELSARMTGK